MESKFVCREVTKIRMIKCQCQGNVNVCTFPQSTLKDVVCRHHVWTVLGEWRGQKWFRLNTKTVAGRRAERHLANLVFFLSRQFSPNALRSKHFFSECSAGKQGQRHFLSALFSASHLTSRFVLISCTRRPVVFLPREAAKSSRVSASAEGQGSSPWLRPCFSWPGGASSFVRRNHAMLAWKIKLRCSAAFDHVRAAVAQECASTSVYAR